MYINFRNYSNQRNFVEKHSGRFQALILTNVLHREAAIRPAAGSMIPEIFKSSSRGTANGILSWGIYWGYGLTFTLGNYLTPLNLFK